MTRPTTDDIEFPDIQQGVLDDETLARYFEDLEHARVFAVMVKGAPHKYARTRNLELSTGRKLLLDGLAHGLQIRYVWKGDEWWDTLSRTGDEIRLIRILQTDPRSDTE